MGAWCILYELMYLRPAFYATSLYAVRNNIMGGRFAPPPTSRTTWPASLTHAMRCLPEGETTRSVER